MNFWVPKHLICGIFAGCKTIKFAGKNSVCKKVKQSLYRPGGAQRVPGSYFSQIS